MFQHYAVSPAAPHLPSENNRKTSQQAMAGLLEFCTETIPASVIPAGLLEYGADTIPASIIPADSLE